MNDLHHQTSQLDFTLILCGVKPHRLSKSISKFETKLLQLHHQAATHDDDQTKRSEEALFHTALAQVIAEDVLKTPATTDQDYYSLLPLLRVQRSLQIQQKKRPLIFLVCGPSGAGKSTLAAQLANRLSISSVLSTDSIRESLRNNPQAVASCPELKTSTFEQATLGSGNTTTNNTKSTSLVADPAVSVITHFQKQSRMILDVLENYIDNVVLPKGQSVIVEGAHLVPSWVRTMLMKYCIENKNKKSGESNPIIVPVFAFVGGSSRHMHRFIWRRNKKSSKKPSDIEEEEEEEEDRQQTGESEVNNHHHLSVPPSHHTTEKEDKNRYLKNFDQIRLIHHWFLSELGHWFIHHRRREKNESEIGEYTNGGIDFITTKLDGDTTRNSSESRGREQDDDNENSRSSTEDDNRNDDDEHGDFFPHSASNSSNNFHNNSSMSRTVSTSSTGNASKNKSSSLAAANDAGTTPLQSSRLWFRWRRRAQGVVKLVRAHQAQSLILEKQKQQQMAINNNNKIKSINTNNYNSDDDGNENGSTFCSLVPIIDNINLDRSVNIAHSALMSWLDTENFEAVCLEKVLPKIIVDADATQNLSFSNNNSSMTMTTAMQRQSSLNDDVVAEDQSAILSFLQKRRVEKRQSRKEKRLLESPEKKIMMMGDVRNHNGDKDIRGSSSDDHYHQHPPHHPSLTDYGTSSGEECGGSVSNCSSSVGSS